MTDPKDFLLMTLDPGSSDSKIVYRIVQDSTLSKPDLLLMGPHLAEVSGESIEAYEANRITHPKLEDEAWVEYDGSYYAVGFFAQKNYDACVVLESLKYEGAIPKVLAAVGALAAQAGLPEQFDLALALPLPFSEWEDRDKFEREVTRALSSFSFRGRTISVEVKFFLCVPEGGGHTMTRGNRLGREFYEKKILSLMFGFRDVSAVLSERGVITGTTQKLGLARMIELVQSRTSGQQTQALLRAIHQAGKNIKPAKFEHLAQSKKERHRVEEIAQIAEAVRYARKEYWERVLRWLGKVVPSDVDEVIIGGGTSEYLKPELKSFFTKNYKGVSVSWAAELEKDVQLLFNLESNKDSLCLRLTDAYGLSRFMQQQVFPKLGQPILD